MLGGPFYRPEKGGSGVAEGGGPGGVRGFNGRHGSFESMLAYWKGLRRLRTRFGMAR
jgi:hypothetical protein